MLFTASLILAGAGAALAQRPTNTSICDYYTTALFKDNTAANQLTLVTAVVNRAAIGNTTANSMLTGIVGPGMYNGKSVDISIYFTGAQNSTNRGGTSGVSVNFLDGGGAAPLMAGKAANDDSSNQYTLFTHLYEYFGAALGCSDYGMTGYMAYAGDASMFEVHKFMGLDSDQVGYFIEQVGLSAASFGVTTSDVTAVGDMLSKLFNVKCAAKTTVIPAQGAQLQSICIDPSCAQAANATCDAYPAEPMPVNVTMASGGSSNSSGSGSSGSGSGSSTMSGSMTATGTSGSSGSMTSKPASATGNAASNLVAGSLLGVAALVFAL